MKLTTMSMEPKSPKGKNISTIPIHQNFSSRLHKFVPVVIERYKKNHVPGLPEKFKFIASSDMTVSQLVFILRHRMKLSPSQDYHLLYSKGRTAVMMSQLLSEISSKYKDSIGVLYFTFAAQNTFGCPVPRVKPIKSKFPGIEPNPFGAPEPQDEVDFLVPVNPEGNSFNSLSLFTQYMLTIPPAFQPVGAAMPLPLTAHSTLMTHNFTQTEPEHNLLLGAEHAGAIGSIPMELSESEPLPLDFLIQALNHIVPLWHIQLFPTIPFHVAIDCDLLINSLNRLIQALENHVPSVENVVSHPNLQAPLHPWVQHIMANFLPNPAASQAGQEDSGPPPTLLELVNHATNALDLAHQVLAGLQDPSFSPPVQDGMMQLSVLAQYFNQVSQHLEFQNLVNASPAGQPHEMPLVLMDPIPDSEHPAMPEVLWPSPNQISFFNPSLYLGDSDSLSEEEGEFDYFCDILL